MYAYNFLDETEHATKAGNTQRTIICAQCFFSVSHNWIMFFFCFVSPMQKQVKNKRQQSATLIPFSEK